MYEIYYLNSDLDYMEFYNQEEEDVEHELYYEDYVSIDYWHLFIELYSIWFY